MFDPTPEQATCITAAKTGGNLVITAGAGTGKTSTLMLQAEALAPAKGIYIAYNKAIAKEAAAKFPTNVECRTAHSFAYRAVGYAYKGRLDSPRVPGKVMGELLQIDRTFKIETIGDDGKLYKRDLDRNAVASLVMQTLNKWAHSSDRTVSVKHTPIVPGAEDISYELATYLVDRAQWLWDIDLRHPEPRLKADYYDYRNRTNQVVFVPFSHDLYVKLWALSNPKLPGTFVLYDEAQDADPCIAGIILAQSHMQLIAVGDESQAIYGWRGATDAMKNWPAETRVSLTKSFRFGPAIAAEANRFLALLDAPLRIEGFDRVASTVGPIDLMDADAVLCRTNASIIKTALSIHYARKVSIANAPAIRKFAEAAASLQEGKRAAWHPELGIFHTWDDVLEYAKSDDGSDLRAMVNIVEDFGVETIYEVCDKSFKGKNVPKGTLVLTTAHTAKGLEWDRVIIADDFTPQADPETGETRQPSRSELMLMYVAVTRAKLQLDCSALDWVL